MSLSAFLSASLPASLPASLLDLLARLTPPLTPAAQQARTLTRQHEQSLTKPPKALGKLEQITEHLAVWQEQSPPKLDTIHTLVFAGKHGVCTENISAYPASVTEQMVENFHAKGAAVNQLCKLAQSTLSVHPVNFSSETENFLHKPAMSQKTCTNAVQQGIDTIRQNYDLLVLGEMGIGNTTAAAAMLTALYGGTAQQWTGTGTGLDPVALKHKIHVVEKAVRRFNRNRPPNESLVSCAWSVLCELGGFELAALVGALVKARAERIPVLLDGYPCCAAAALVKALHPQSLENCLLAHLPQQHGANNLYKKLGCGKPLLDLNMRLGEASGATLAVLVVRAALACHTGMHSFEQAGVDKAL